MFFQIRLALRNQHIFKHRSCDRHSADLCSLWTMFPLAHSAGIKLIPHGEVEEPVQVSQGFCPQRTWGRDCRFGQELLWQRGSWWRLSYVFLTPVTVVQISSVSMKLQSTGPKESEDHPSKSTMSCWGKDPSSITDYLRDFGEVVYHLWTSGSLFIEWTTN